jgi:hypothetical protein
MAPQITTCKRCGVQYDSGIGGTLSYCLHCMDAVRYAFPQDPPLAPKPLPCPECARYHDASLAALRRADAAEVKLATMRSKCADAETLAAKLVVITAERDALATSRAEAARMIREWYPRNCAFSHESPVGSILAKLEEPL